MDLVIRGGTLLDGTGRPPYEADLGIAGGRIAAVGRIAERGTEEITAKGLIVTPGFVDIHTHFDGQVTWDDRLAPTSMHGVTTAIGGNCGVGFAPCRPPDRESLIRLMEGIEDIPEAVMAEGIPWQWETFPEYLDFLAARRYDIDFGTQIPHAALRVFVMGKRGIDREPATRADLQSMRQLVEAGIRAGALGVSTTRTLIHRTRDGVLGPTPIAAEEELRALVLGMRDAGRGVFEMIDDFAGTDDTSSTEFDLMRRLVAASGRPLTYSLAAIHPWRSLLRMTKMANAEGVAIRGQVNSRAIGRLYGLELSSNPLSFRPSWRAIATLSRTEKVAALRDPALRARLLAEPPQNAAPNLLRDAVDYDRMFELGDPPNYEPAAHTSAAAIGKRLGRPADEIVYDWLLQDDGRAIIYHPAGYSGSLDAEFELLSDPGTVPGLGDGGAHVGRICDASGTTFLLSHWTRDRRGDRLALVDVVRALTHDSASVVGLSDRGTIAVGLKADLNVIDYDRLALHPPVPTRDLPAGGMRLLQRADGYVANIVSGVVTYRDGEPTGALPGRLLRSDATRQTASAGR